MPKNIDESSLVVLRNKGFNGAATTESVVAKVAEILFPLGLHRVGDRAWWELLKNRKENKGKDFDSLVIKEFENRL